MVNCTEGVKEGYILFFCQSQENESGEFPFNNPLAQ